MKHWLTDLLNFVFPATCHVCEGKLAPHERFVCTKCLAELPRSGYHRRPLNPIEERLAGKFPFERATGHFLYNRNAPISTIIQDMKYRHYPGIGQMLGRIAAEELFPSGFFNDIDVIIPVPMHFFKQAIRGYNQTHHIAKGISDATGIPVSLALKAIRPHRTQTSLSHQQRLSNTSDIFSVPDPQEYAGKGILLVDDVCTTGSTLCSAGKAITGSIPSAHVSVFTLGVTF